MSRVDEELAKGLYSWYPFKEGSSILYFINGGSSSETACYSDSSADYIVASKLVETCKEPVVILKELRRILKDDGHLLLGCENRMGLRYFCGDREPYSGNCFDGIENYNSYFESDWNNMQGRLFASYELDELLNEVGFSRRRRLSVLPGLEVPQALFSDECQPKMEYINQIEDLGDDCRTKFLNERNLYDSIINNGMFHQMANAYLFDCSPSGEFYDVNYVKTTVCRWKVKASAVIVEKSGVVVKRALYPEGNEIIKKIIDNSKAISERGVKVIPTERVEFYDGCIGARMPYVNYESAGHYIKRMFNLGKEEFARAVHCYLEQILKSSESGAEQPLLDELGVLYKNVYGEMSLVNSFFDGHDFVFYDQEYVCHNYPVNVLIIRELMMIYSLDMRIAYEYPMETFLEEYNIANNKEELIDICKNTLGKAGRNDELDFIREHYNVDIKQIFSNRQRINFVEDRYVNISDKETKDVFLFGSGSSARRFVDEYGDRYNIKGMVDNNVNRWGQVVDGLRVLAPDVLRDVDKNSTKVIVCTQNYNMIPVQLQNMGVEDFAIYNPFK